MTPTMLARLRAAMTYVMVEVNKNTEGAAIISGMIEAHSATVKTAPTGNTIRCAGITASCTWSRDEGLLKAWRKNATIKLAMEAAK